MGFTFRRKGKIFINFVIIGYNYSNFQVRVLSGDKVNVTYLAASPNKQHIAVGYADGTIKTFDLKTGENVSIFVGHRSEITTLRYDREGHRLASGSKVKKFDRENKTYKIFFNYFFLGYRYYSLGCCS